MAINKRQDPEYWKNLIERFDSSHITLTEFCEREGLSPRSFRRWKKKLSQASRGVKSLRSRIRDRKMVNVRKRTRKAAAQKKDE